MTGDLKIGGIGDVAALSHVPLPAVPEALAICGQAAVPTAEIILAWR